MASSGLIRQGLRMRVCICLVRPDPPGLAYVSLHMPRPAGPQWLRMASSVLPYRHGLACRLAPGLAQTTPASGRVHAPDAIPARGRKSGVVAGAHGRPSWDGGSVGLKLPSGVPFEPVNGQQRQGVQLRESGSGAANPSAALCAASLTWNSDAVNGAREGAVRMVV
eukprot:19933-Chlamydomonas_euryale.AAC.5